MRTRGQNTKISRRFVRPEGNADEAHRAMSWWGAFLARIERIGRSGTEKANKRAYRGTLER